MPSEMEPQNSALAWGNTGANVSRRYWGSPATFSTQTSSREETELAWDAAAAVPAHGRGWHLLVRSPLLNKELAERPLAITSRSSGERFVPVLHSPTHRGHLPPLPQRPRWHATPPASWGTHHFPRPGPTCPAAAHPGAWLWSPGTPSLTQHGHKSAMPQPI